MRHFLDYISTLDKEHKKANSISPELIKKVLKLSKKYWTKLLILSVLLGLSAVTTVLPSILIKELFDIGLAKKDLVLINWLGIALIGTYLISGLISLLSQYVNSIISEGIVSDLRVALYLKFQKLPITYYMNTQSGENLSRFSQDIFLAQKLISDTTVSVVTNIGTLLFALYMVISFDWRLALIALTIVPIAILPARKASPIVRNIRKRWTDEFSKMNSFISNRLSTRGVVLTRIFSAKQKDIDDFGLISQDIKKISVQSAVVWQAVFIVLGILTSSALASSYWFGSIIALKNEAITIGAIIATSSLISKIYDPLVSLLNLPMDISQSLVGFERLFEILDLEEEVQDGYLKISKDSMEGNIVFKNVSFSYPIHKSDSQKMIRADEKEKLYSFNLNDISFEVEGGKSLGIVGKSGSGKTTLTYLLARLYYPDDGCIFLDGIDLKNFTSDSVANFIGYVNQEISVVPGTIRDNLLYAKQNASQAEIEEALQRSEFNEVLKNLKKGIDTFIGDQGYMLSGGERQRLALARVFLRDPKILIFDESTANLDLITENSLKETINNEFNNKTRIIVAHRLSMIEGVDQVIVLSDGKISQIGTYEELATCQGEFKEMLHTSTISRN